MTRQPADELGPRANRTIARILEATREVFLSRGYGGTTIDEIAKAAGVSRASFYTYFPSKREVLLAVGARSGSEAIVQINKIRALEPSVAALTEWLAEYWVLLDRHGAFAFAWTQAAQEDFDIRTGGSQAHLEMCRVFGKRLGELGGQPPEDPVALGLVAFSALERGWDYYRLYADSVDLGALQHQLARTLWASVRPVAASARKR